MAFHKAKALQEAEKSVSQGKISHAIRQYQEILDNDPADVSLLNTIGDLYIRDRNITEGLKQFHKLAEAFMREGFNVKAIAIYRKITKVDPASVDTLLKLAELYQLQGLSREAREQYLQATEFFKKRNQAERALDVLRKLVQLDPENINFRNRLATECEQFGKREDAARAYLDSAEILLRRDDQPAAESALHKAAELDPKNSKVQFLRARVAIARQQPGEAEKIINASPELQADPSGKRILLDSYLALRRLPEAQRLVLEVFRASPGDFAPVSAVSALLVEKGDIDDAYELLASMADTLVSQHAAAPLIEALRHIWDAAPSHIRTLELLHGLCERTADEYTLPEVLEALGRAYEEAGEPELAEAAYLKLVEREAGNEHFHALLNAIQKKLGREVKPIEFAAKEIPLEVVEAPPKLAVVDANHDAMVKEAFENSDLFCRYNLTDKAIAELEKVLRVYPDQIDVHQRIMEMAHKGFPARATAAAAQLARIFSEQGDHEMANKYHAIATAKGSLHEIPLPSPPPAKKVEEPAAPPPPSPEAAAPAEFPIAAIPPQEPVAAMPPAPLATVPPPAEGTFDLTPPEASTATPDLPPAPPVTTEQGMELDLSGDFEAFGFASTPPAPAETPVPPAAEPPAPVEFPIAAEQGPAAPPEEFPIAVEAVEQAHAAPLGVPAVPEEAMVPAAEPIVPAAEPLAITPEPGPAPPAQIPLGEEPEVPASEAPVFVDEPETPAASEEHPAPSMAEAAAPPLESLPLAPPAPPPVEEEEIPADLEDSRIEVEFYLENGFIDEARQAVAALEEKYPSSALVAELRRQLMSRLGGAPAPAPPAEVPRSEEEFVADSPASGVQTEASTVEEPSVPEPSAAGVQPEEPALAESPAIAPPIESAAPVESAASAEPVELGPPEPEVVPPEPELAPPPEPAAAEAEAAHEEWELPTTYAATPEPVGAEDYVVPPAVAEPESAPAQAEMSAAQEAEFSAPPHGDEFVIEDLPAPETPGLDMLDDLAGDLASTLDGMAEPAEMSAAPAASVLNVLPSPPQAHEGAAQLSGLLAEMEDPGDAAAAAAKDDPETHYNLGVAFREMGLLDEAIGEFQKVVKGAGKGGFPSNFLQACSLLAICFMEKKMPGIAVKWYMRALETPGLDDEACMALQYDLGLAYELAGDSRNALERFTEVYSQNIDFRDVADKIRELQQKA